MAHLQMRIMVFRLLKTIKNRVNLALATISQVKT